MDDCTDKNCEFSHIHHVHYKVEELIDNNGYRLLESNLRDNFYDRFKILPNGSLIFTNLDKSNISICPNYCMYVG